MSNDAPEDFRGLPTTDWSLVAHAGLPVEQTGLESLNELLSRYRPALKAHLVLKKKFPHWPIARNVSPSCASDYPA